MIGAEQAAKNAAVGWPAASSQVFAKMSFPGIRSPFADLVLSKTHVGRVGGLVRRCCRWLGGSSARGRRGRQFTVIGVPAADGSEWNFAEPRTVLRSGSPRFILISCPCASRPCLVNYLFSSEVYRVYHRVFVFSWLSLIGDSIEGFYLLF